jgi:hypothetical protein
MEGTEKLVITCEGLKLTFFMNSQASLTASIFSASENARMNRSMERGDNDRPDACCT